MLWLYGGVHSSSSFCPPKWDGGRKDSTYRLANGLFNNPSSALPPPASCEESLPHYPASITHPRGSTELKEIFYDPTLRYVLLKAEHRPPLPHSSDQRLCWVFFFPSFPSSCCRRCCSQSIRLLGLAVGPVQGLLTEEENMKQGRKYDCLVYLRMLRIQMGLGMWSHAAEIADGCRNRDECGKVESWGDVTPWKDLSHGWR